MVKSGASDRHFTSDLQNKWPDLVEEMRGIVQGSGVGLSGIVALNVRTETAFGLYKPPDLTDGCTSLHWKTGSTSFLTQNWDWLDEQRKNISLKSKPCLWVSISKHDGSGNHW